MLRPVILALLLLAARPVCAQESAQPVDFTLRPTQDSVPADPDDAGDLWSFDDAAPRVVPAGLPAQIAPAANAEPASPKALAARADDDPFAPVGMRFGTFIIRPSLDIGIQATDNADGGPGRDQATGLLLAPAIAAKSDWARHSLEADAAGTLVEYGDRTIDVREGSADAKGRYDISRNTAVDAEAGYRRDQETYTNPDTPAAAVERPVDDTFTAGLGVTQRFNRVSVRVGGEAERQLHSDVALSGGGTASRSDLDYTRYGLRVRTAVEASPAFTPYLEGAAGQKRFDETVDASGFRRSGNWGELRGGLIVDLGEKMQGDVSVGYYRENPDDARLDTLSGALANASLMWSPHRLTTVKLDLATSVDPTSIAGASGSFVYSGTLSVARQFTARLALEAGAGVDYQRYVGADLHQTIYSGFAGASYAFNRTAALQARYTHARTDSSDAGSSGDENIVSVRLRLQR